MVEIAYICLLVVLSCKHALNVTYSMVVYIPGKTNVRSRGLNCRLHEGEVCRPYIPSSFDTKVC